MLEKLRKMLEAGARHSAADNQHIQTMHDSAVALGATCSVSEAADFSNTDVMTLLQLAVKRQFKDSYSYPYICDVYDDYLVFMSDYSHSTCYKCDYSFNDSGAVTLGTPTAVVRKVTYIEPNTATQESGETELESDSVALVENDLIEAKMRVVKLIAPGFGSSGYYPADVLKRDGPNVFKAGLHNFVDHPTAIEEKERPEGSINRLASVLTEDATWKDDYQGHGPGLYSKVKVNDVFGEFLNGFSSNIGMSIRASGKVRMGEIDGRKGPIVESITAAKSVDYVTLPGCGGKVLDLMESAKTRLTESGENTMADEKEKAPIVDTNAALLESLNQMNARIVRNEAADYVERVLRPLKVKDAIKARIAAVALNSVPLTEAHDIDRVKFDGVITEAIDSETAYLSSVGVFGKITGFGESQTQQKDAPTIEALMTKLDESLKQLV